MFGCLSDYSLFVFVCGTVDVLRTCGCCGMWYEKKPKKLNNTKNFGTTDFSPFQAFVSPLWPLLPRPKARPRQCTSNRLQWPCEWSLLLSTAGVSQQAVLLSMSSHWPLSHSSSC